ncbi:MAG: YgjV family protein [Spirochaetota bacterium]
MTDFAFSGFVQGLGFIALIFVFFSFQKSNKREILLYLVFAQLLFAVHFGLLHAYTAMSMNLLAVLRGVVFLRDRTVAWLYLFVFLFLTSGYLSWEGWRSALPITAMVLETIAFWIQKPQYIRWLSLTPRPFWLSYNILVVSLPGIVSEVFVLTSLLIALYRFRKK